MGNLWVKLLAKIGELKECSSTLGELMESPSSFYELDKRSQVFSFLNLILTTMLDILQHQANLLNQHLGTFEPLD